MNIFRTINLLKGLVYDYDFRRQTGFILAMIVLFIELPLQNILLYQESYWGFSENIRMFIRLIIDIPIIGVLFFFFFTDLLQKKTDKRIKVTFIITLLVVIQAIIIILVNWNLEKLQSFNNSNLKVFFWYISYFIIGYFITGDISKLSKLKLLIISAQVLMIAQIIVFFDLETISINLEDLNKTPYLHLRLGNSFAIWSILILSLVNKTKRLLLYFLFLLFLFAYSSRGVFYSFLIILPIIISPYIVEYFNYILIGFLVAIILILTLFPVISEHRMFSILICDDLSLEYRVSIMEKNLPDLYENWLLGDYYGFSKFAPPDSNYIHNIVSIWRHFGIIPFLLIISLFIIKSFDIKFPLQNSTSISENMLLIYYIYFLILILFAKSYIYYYYFLIFGMQCPQYLKKKITHSFVLKKMFQ